MHAGKVCGFFPYIFNLYLFSRDIYKHLFLFSFFYTPTVVGCFLGFFVLLFFFFWNAIYSFILLNAVTSFEFNLIPGLLWWVIKCFFHVERLLCLWIIFLQQLSCSVWVLVQSSSRQEEFCHFVPSIPLDQFTQSKRRKSFRLFCCMWFVLFLIFPYLSFSYTRLRNEIPYIFFYNE